MARPVSTIPGRVAINLDSFVDIMLYMQRQRGEKFALRFLQLLDRGR